MLIFLQCEIEGKSIEKQRENLTVKQANIFYAFCHVRLTLEDKTKFEFVQNLITARNTVIRTGQLFF